MTAFACEYNNSCTFCGSSFGATNDMTAHAIMVCAFVFSMALSLSVVLVNAVLVVRVISIIAVIICVIIKNRIREIRENTVAQ